MECQVGSSSCTGQVTASPRRSARWPADETTTHRWPGVCPGVWTAVTPGATVVSWSIGHRRGSPALLRNSVVGVQMGADDVGDLIPLDPQGPEADGKLTTEQAAGGVTEVARAGDKGPVGDGAEHDVADFHAAHSQRSSGRVGHPLKQMDASGQRA